jgi:hypothetical protein
VVGFAYSHEAETCCLQFVVALLLGAGLSAGGFVRVYLSTHSVVSASAITASLLFIVLTSGFLQAAARAGGAARTMTL